MEYLTQSKEIVRRKRAYLTLSLSMLAGLYLFSNILKLQITWSNYLLFTFTLFLIGSFSFNFLQNLSKVKITLTNKNLSREANRVTEDYPLDKINQIKIKRTANNTIREIYIWLNNGKAVYISALDKSEDFIKNLLQKLNKNVSIKETREPIDFDHPLFYSLLGFPISGLGVWAIKSIEQIDVQQVIVLTAVLFVYLIALGLYFIIATPLSKRYISNSKLSDLLFGAFMIISGLVILYQSFIRILP